MISTDEMVKITNHSSDMVLFAWAKKEFRVRPGGVNFAPLAAVNLKLGNPYSGPEKRCVKLDENTVVWIASREDELKRLSVLYGVYDPSKITEMKALAPNVSVEDLSGDEHFIFPLDDPDCQQFTGESVVRSEREFLLKQYQDMERRMHAMQEQMSQINNLGEAGLENVKRDVEETPIGTPTDSGIGLVEDSPQPASSTSRPRRVPAAAR